MLCEVIAYILSRQRLSAKTFVTGCVFYALQDRLSLWMLCDTAGVGGFPLHFSTGSPFGHHPRLRMVCPLWGQWVRAGRFLFSLPLHFSTSPRVRPSGITRGYAWCVSSGDSGGGSHHKKVCIVSVANLSQLCTLPFHYLSCILAAQLTPPAEAHHA